MYRNSVCVPYLLHPFSAVRPSIHPLPFLSTFTLGWGSPLVLSSKNRMPSRSTRMRQGWKEAALDFGAGVGESESKILIVNFYASLLFSCMCYVSNRSSLLGNWRNSRETNQEDKTEEPTPSFNLNQSIFVNLLTAIYAFVPTYVFAMEFTSCQTKQLVRAI